MEIKKIDSMSQNVFEKGSTVKKGELVVARIIEKFGTHGLKLNIKGKDYSAVVKEKIEGDMFLARVQRLSPKIVLKFIKTLGKKSTKYNIGNYFFNFKKEFIQKLINSDNFVVDDFFKIEDPKLIVSEKGLIPLLKKYLATWYAPILKDSFSKQAKINQFQDLYHKFLVFQSLYNIYNLEQLSFLFPLVIGNKKYLLSMMVLNRKNDLSQSIFVRVYLNKDYEILLLIYLDQKVVSCSISANNEQLIDGFSENINILKERLEDKLSGKKLDIRIVPYDYLKVIDDKNFKTIDIRM